MSRPMLLSYLDDLVVDENIKYQFGYQIYEKLIEKWIDRESQKCKMPDEQKIFKDNLRKLAHETAREMYFKWQSDGVLYLSKNDTENLTNKYHIELTPDEVKGKSLLTCDPLRNWKFAHKSILEYFLAKECLKNLEFAVNFNFTGMDMAKHFYGEMAPFFNATNFVKVKGGTFKMGDEHGDLNEVCRPVHEVIIADFFISRILVTQKQWFDLMGSNPSRFKNGDDYPVERVSWDDVQEFIEKLNEKTGLKFRLPTEAEWEYASRGGHKAQVEDGIHVGKFKYAGSNELDEVGWFNENSGGKTHPVRRKKPNELGLYDMSGNVWEWCQDWYDDNFYKECHKKGVVENPVCTKEGSSRVMRGGSWFSFAEFCRSANRSRPYPVGRSNVIGFRLVFVPQSVESSSDLPVS
ncbi:MAG: SUMF1/EgtB/PvdO family nonheme iron enzyme [Candidatus Lokiarchaeota archaeon]|nr:SUMF1/EgtB/PvdO family nonheme iron enzyme [Candidatus Lokiarchaeota archaeon]